jgi:hypothetical protein
MVKSAVVGPWEPLRRDLEAAVGTKKLHTQLTLDQLQTPAPALVQHVTGSRAACGQPQQRDEVRLRRPTGDRDEASAGRKVHRPAMPPFLKSASSGRTLEPSGHARARLHVVQLGIGTEVVSVVEGQLNLVLGGSRTAHAQNQQECHCQEPGMLHFSKPHFFVFR